MQLLCYRCKLSKPTTEFHRNAKSKRGYQTMCKMCKAGYQQEHAEEHLAASRKSYAKNIEKERKKSHDYHVANPEKAAARDRKHKATKRDRINELARKRREANIEEARRKQREWTAANPKSRKASHKKWVRKNKARVYATNNARRTLTRHGINGEAIDLDVLYERDKGICQICHKRCTRKQASREHVIPLSKDGTHSWQNVVLAHIRCNSKKGNRTIPQQQRLFG